MPPRDRDPSAPLYARAGVDLDHDEAFVDQVKEIARSTFRPEVLSSIGGFAGLFKAPERYDHPIFVAGADGVGTKLKLAAQLARYDTVGIDCVAMVVNDLVVQGAEPLVFLDYLAMGELDDVIAAEAIRGVAEGCRRAGCALLGGETATMPGVYPKGEVELVGFGVGVVERERVIDGSGIREGDVLLGLASNGLHSNGFSLVRRIVEEGTEAGRFDLREASEELNTSVAGALLAPTRIYVKPVLNLLRDFTINGIVHVTGGGFDGNLPRVLPNGVRARIDASAWPRPPIFGFLQRQAEIPEAEMLRVFNCGIGLVLVISRDDADDIQQRLQGMGERTYRIGVVERKAEGDPPIHYAPLLRPALMRRLGRAGARAASGLRARRWDALVVGGALPGLAAAVRLGMAGLRVVLVEEESAAESDERAPELREPFSLTGARTGGVVREALRRLGVPLIEQRSLVSEDLAHQVLLPEARVDVGVPDLCADEWVAWGLVKPDVAAQWLRRLGEIGEACHDALPGQALLRRGSRALGRGAAPRPVALDAEPPPGLAPLFSAQLAALSNLASPTPPPEAAARLLSSVLEGGASFERRGLGLRGALRGRFAALHGELRRISGPFEWVEVGGHPGIARPSGEALLGRLVIGNAPRSRVAAAFASWGHAAPDWLSGPAPGGRRAALEFAIDAEVLPEALARRALQVPPSGPPMEIVQAQGASPETRRLVARLRVADSEEALESGWAALEARLGELLPFSEGRLRRVAAAPRPLWDDELALVDPEPGTGWPAELETRVPGRGARGIHWLDRERVAALGVEGDLLLGVEAGEALAAELV